MGKKITLVFDASNDTNLVSERGTDESIIKNARWFINCAMAGIAESYSQDSVRYKEMEGLCDNLNKQFVAQLTEKDKDLL